MLRVLHDTETVETSLFGRFCPYWTKVDGRVLVADTAEEIITAIPQPERVIDPVALVGLLQFNYILGDRDISWRTHYGNSQLMVRYRCSTIVGLGLTRRLGEIAIGLARRFMPGPFKRVIKGFLSGGR